MRKHHFRANPINCYRKLPATTGRSQETKPAGSSPPTAAALPRNRRRESRRSSACISSRMYLVILLPSILDVFSASPREPDKIIGDRRCGSCGKSLRPPCRFQYPGHHASGHKARLYLGTRSRGHFFRHKRAPPSHLRIRSAALMRAHSTRNRMIDCARCARTSLLSALVRALYSR